MALSLEEKHMFLDIACFFLGEHRGLAINVWETCEGSGSLEFNTLVNKCLVELDGNNCFKMHDLVRDFGREKDLRQSRGIIAATHDWYWYWKCSSYYKPPLEEIELSELKILAVRGDSIDEQIGGNLENLVWFRWFECPYPNISRWLSSMKYLTVWELFEAKIEEWPLPSEQVRLRELRLIRTKLISISIPENVCPNLEHFDLTFNDHLMEVNYLPPNLLKLTLAFCKQLEHIQALKHLPQLRALNLSRCSELRELSALGHLLSLETLNVSGCSNLQHIQALENLPQLRALDLSLCSELRELPALGHLLSLETLDVSCCSNLQHIQALEHLPQLRVLNLSRCSELRELPALVHLLSLETLDVSGCSNLQHMQALENLPRLRVLNISGCPKLQQIANVGRLISLEDVEADGCWKLQGIQGLDQLEILESLTLSTTNSRAIWNATGHMEKLPRRMCLSARARGNFLHIDARYFNIANLPAVDLNTPRRRHRWKLLLWGEEKNPRTSFILSFVVQFPRAQLRQWLHLTIVDENDQTVVGWRTRVEKGEWLYAFCLRGCDFTRYLHTAHLSLYVEGYDEDEGKYEVKSGSMATGGEEEILEAVKKLFVP